MAVVLGLALLPLTAVLLVLAGAAILALVLAEPVFGLYLAVLSVPVQELVQLPGGLSFTQAAMLLAGGAWALRVLAHPERRIVKGALLPLWAVLLWALLLSTSFTPYSRTAGLKETLRWGEAFLVWLIAVNTLKRPWQAAGLIVCLLLAPAADAALGLVQFATGDGPPSFRITAGAIFVRAYGTIGQPNSFAGYLNMAWPLALALAVGVTAALWRRDDARGQGSGVRGQGSDIGERTTQNSKLKTQNFSPIPHARFVVVGLWVVALVLMAALAASFSRGAWVGALVGLLGMIVVQGRRALRWGVGLACAGALLLALAGAGVLPGVLAARLASITSNLAFFDAASVQVTPENFSIVDRMSQIQAGWRMFRAYPLTGVGPGNYTPAYSDFAVLPWYSSRGHAHNYYLHMAAEAGIIGALAYIALLIGVSYQAVGTTRRARGTFWRSAAIGCCGIIAAVAGHDMFENLHVLSMGIQLAAVWGLVVAIPGLEETRRQGDKAQG